MVDQAAIDELVTWMSEGAPPLSDGRSIVAEICNRLVAAGVPIEQFRLFLFTIHPLIKGRRLQWLKGQEVTSVTAPRELFQSDQYLKSSLPVVIETRKSLRRRLVDPNCPDDFNIVAELRADGFTDYLAQPVIYIDGEVHTMSWATRHPQGFSDDEIATLERIRAPMSRLVESYLLRVNAAYIISTYVGRNAGDHVLKGHIARGDAEEIEAAILFADLKNYTHYSNTHPADEVMARLNRFYDAFESPIVEQGGEILKFMGDGLLAIFPVKGDKKCPAVGPRDTVRAASAAVRKAQEALADEEIGFRTALHFGKLHYGNIGGSKRLDFTAIGPAVNLCARLLSAAASIGQDHVASKDAVGLLAGAMREVAKLQLKGFSDETPIFA
jgi:adenylate cyclase